jgi:23S rRNA pseudouridine1911/1915/1917 synthase
MSAEPVHVLYVQLPEGEPARLDAFVAEAVNGLSRRRTQQLIEDGRITVNCRPARKGRTLRDGDTVEIWDAVEPGWTAASSPEIDLCLIHEDAHLIVVDKPSGIPTIPLAADEGGTLAGGIVARFPECARLGRSPGDAGLIQRLDRETSGLVLAARSRVAFEALIDLQERGAIEKTYLALTRGRAADLPASVDVPLGPAGRRRAKVRRDPAGRPAHTALAAADERDGWLLVEVAIHRGARHQIRAHLAHAGFPIAGDALYDGPAVQGLERLFLHATRLRLPHPITGEPLELHSPLPPDLAAHLRPRET